MFQIGKLTNFPNFFNLENYRNSKNWVSTKFGMFKCRNTDISEFQYYEY